MTYNFTHDLSPVKYTLKYTKYTLYLHFYLVYITPIINHLYLV